MLNYLCAGYPIQKIKIDLLSQVYKLQYKQQLPVSINEAWNFFSRPENLQQITPEHMGFIIKSEAHTDRMYAGQIIEYTIKPLLGIPLYWMTEITHLEPLVYFVDEQRYGPYSLWHHQHHFRETPEGVEMTDIVHYKIPFGFIGTIANSLFVRKQLADIFSYRSAAINRLFR